MSNPYTISPISNGQYHVRMYLDKLGTTSKQIDELRERHDIIHKEDPHFGKICDLCDKDFVGSMKICTKCFQEFDEEEDLSFNPAEALTDIFLESVGMENGRNLCPPCSNSR